MQSSPTEVEPSNCIGCVAIYLLMAINSECVEAAKNLVFGLE